MDQHDDRRTPDERPDGLSRARFERDDLASDELLSAYLDGECTAADQAQLEERLASNAELRQLVDELRSVRSSLELLPQYRLRPDFAELVLRRAERDVLTGDSAAAAAGVSAASHAAHDEKSNVLQMGETMRRPHESIRSARPFLWTLAALAAAVLLLVTNRDAEIRRDPIARGPDVPSQRAAEELASAAKAPAVDSEKRETSIARSLDSADSRSGSAFDPTATSDGAALSDRVGDIAKRAKEEAIPPIVSEARPKNSALDELIDKQDVAANGSIFPRADGPRQASDVPGVPSEQSLAMEADAKQTGTEGLSGYALRGAGDELHVIEVVVSREAWQRGAVEGTLLNNRIATLDNDPSAGVERVDENELGALGTSPSELDRQKLLKESNAGKPVEKSSAEKKTILGNDAKAVEEQHEALTADSMELMVVSATAAQMAATLDDFVQEPHHFQVVQVTDATLSTQDLADRSEPAVVGRVYSDARGGVRFNAPQSLSGALDKATRYDRGGYGASATAHDATGKARDNEIGKSLRETESAIEAESAEPAAPEPPAADLRQVVPSTDAIKDTVKLQLQPSGAGVSSKEAGQPMTRRALRERARADAVERNVRAHEKPSAEPKQFGSLPAATAPAPGLEQDVDAYSTNTARGIAGGFGGGGYGGRDGGAGFGRSAGELPLGWAKRVPLQSSPGSAQMVPGEPAHHFAFGVTRSLAQGKDEQSKYFAGGLGQAGDAAPTAQPGGPASIPARPSRAPISDDVSLKPDFGLAIPAAQQQFVLLFRIVDEPLATAASQRANRAEAAEDAAGQPAPNSAGRENLEKAPVPAPAAGVK